MNIIGEGNEPQPIDAGQPIDQKLCPEMSALMPMQTALGEVEMVMHAAPCASNPGRSRGTSAISRERAGIANGSRSA